MSPLTIACLSPIVISPLIIAVVESLRHIQLFVQPARLPLSFTISWSLLKFVFIESVMLSNHLIFCCPFFLLPTVFPSIRVFSNALTLLIRWPMYWSFSISTSSEFSGLISFRMDWFDLLAVLGTLKSLLQHHSSKASILQGSALWSTSVCHYWKNIALTIQTFVNKVMSLPFNRVSRFVIVFLLGSKYLLITIHSDFGDQENKVCHCFHCFPIYLPWSDETGCHGLYFLNVEF